MGLADPKHLWGWRICAFVSLALGVLFILVGIWVTHLYHRFTPVYRQITCGPEEARVRRTSFSLSSGLTLDFDARTTCNNPNPYSIELASVAPAQVYLGDTRVHIANITDIPRTTLPAGGSGTIETHVSVRPSIDMILRILGSMTLPGLFGGGHMPIYLENNMAIEVDVPFLIGRFTTTRRFTKDCGMDTKVAIGRVELGPLVCADSFEQLPATLPAASESPGLALSGVNLAQEEVEDGTRTKNISCGIGMGLGYGLGVLFLGGALLVLACLGCRRNSTAVAESGVNSSKTMPADRIGAQHEW